MTTRLVRPAVNKEVYIEETVSNTASCDRKPAVRKVKHCEEVVEERSVTRSAGCGSGYSGWCGSWCGFFFLFLFLTLIIWLVLYLGNFGFVQRKCDDDDSDNKHHGKDRHNKCDAGRAFLAALVIAFFLTIIIWVLCCCCGW